MTNNPMPLLLVTICIGVLSFFWVIYLVKIVLHDDAAQEYRRALWRREEEKRREEEDKRKSKRRKTDKPKDSEE